MHTVHLNFKRKLKYFIGRKERYWQKRAQNRYSVMQIMTAKITTLRTLYAHVVLNSVMLREILYHFVLYARHFLPVKFFPEYYFQKLCLELPQNVTWTDE